MDHLNGYLKQLCSADNQKAALALVNRAIDGSWMVRPSRELVVRLIDQAFDEVLELLVGHGFFKPEKVDIDLFFEQASDKLLTFLIERHFIESVGKEETDQLIKRNCHVALSRLLHRDFALDKDVILGNSDRASDEVLALFVDWIPAFEPDDDLLRRFIRRGCSKTLYALISRKFFDPALPIGGADNAEEWAIALKAPGDVWAVLARECRRQTALDVLAGISSP